MVRRAGNGWTEDTSAIRGVPWNMKQSFNMRMCATTLRWVTWGHEICIAAARRLGGWREKLALAWQSSGAAESDLADGNGRVLGNAGNFLDVLLENSPDSIYFKDRQSRIVQYSKSFERWFSLPAGQTPRGKTDFDLFSEEHARQAYPGGPVCRLRGRWIGRAPPDNPDFFFGYDFFFFHDFHYNIRSFVGAGRRPAPYCPLIALDQNPSTARVQLRK